MSNFDLRKYLKNNILTEQTEGKYVWEFTNNAKESGNQGLKYIGILNNKYTTPDSALKIMASQISSKTAGGGPKSLALDIDEFGSENFTAELLAKNVSEDEAKQVKKDRIDELPNDKIYNKSSLANVGPKSRQKLGKGVSVERGGQKYNISQLSSDRNYILVNDEWYDLPKRFDTEVGERVKWGVVDQVLSYDEFIQNHPNAKAQGF
jgi:hypothetical protein